VHIFNNREWADLRVSHDGASGADLLSNVRLVAAQWVLVTYTWDSTSGTRRLQLNTDIVAESNSAAWSLPTAGAPREMYVGRTANYNQGAQGTVRVFRQEFALDDAIEFPVFVPREALPCV
jgi:hypothetical protein